ncbi:MAG: hypothetical protein WEA58_11500 [Balneolaceae bacterium]
MSNNNINGNTTFSDVIETMEQALESIKKVSQNHPKEAEKLYQELMVLQLDLFNYELGRK